MTVSKKLSNSASAFFAGDTSWEAEFTQLRQAEELSFALSTGVGRPLGGGQHSTAARGVREADEWLPPASRSTAPPRSYAQNDMVCLAVAAATAKRPSSRQVGGIQRGGMVVLLATDP